MQAKFMLVKLFTSSFAKLCASKILSTFYPRNDIYLKIRASEIRTSEIRASQGPPVCMDAKFDSLLLLRSHSKITGGPWLA